MTHTLLTKLAAALFALQLLSLPSPLCADGWHNPVLDTPSVDQWLEDVKDVLPDIEEEVRSSQLEAGRSAEELVERTAEARPPAAGDPLERPQRRASIDTKFTPQQEALLSRKAYECLQILAFMDDKNIIPQEFPEFQLKRIPEYRDAAKKTLRRMGPAGTPAVVGQLRASLTTDLKYDAGVTLHKDFYKDLLEVVGHSIDADELTPQQVASLYEASLGHKSGARRKLAIDLEKKLSAKVTFPKLVEWAEASADRAQRAKYYSEARLRLAGANTTELVLAWNHVQDNRGLQQEIIRQLDRRLSEADVSELLRLLDQDIDPKLQQTAAENLSAKSPTYSEVKDDLADIWKLNSSENVTVVKLARWHVANAFQRAPMSQCLLWLGRGDADLNKIIWRQIDARIERADETRKAGYRDVAVKVLQADVDTNTKLAALQLLGRLKDRQAVGPLIELLPTLPKEAGPTAGEVLRNLTGQDFGPRAGDGIVDIQVAAEKWRKWREASGGD